MSDRWKSLADQLGAPKFEPTARPLREPASQEKPAQEPPADPTPSTSSKSEQPDLPNVESPRRRGYFASLAGEQARPADQPAQEERPLEQEIKQHSAESPSKLERSGKRKKAPSWGERIANLLGVSSTDAVDRAESSEPVASSQTPPSKPIAESQPAKSSLFDLPKSDSTNSALTEMFGSPTTSNSSYWDRPKRMVDDVGWGDDSESFEARDKETPSRPQSSDQLSIDSTDSEAASSKSSEDDEQPGRRPRRRRRRGGRGRERSDVEPTRSKSESEAEVSRDYLDESDSDLETDWSFDAHANEPPQSVSTRRSADSHARRSRNDKDSNEEGMVDRRSSRRRVRRGGDQQEARPDSERSHKSPVADEQPRAKSTSDDFDFDQDESDARSDVQSRESSEARRAEPNGRRRKRSRGGAKPATDGSGQRESRKQSRQSDGHGDSELRERDSDDHDSDDDFDSEKRAGGKAPRNIPTWEDALAAVITANLENHRRNDHRNSRGGGKPRGRRP